MPGEKKRRRSTSIRLTDQERARLESKAAEAGYKKLSEYMRQKLLSDDGGVIYNPKALFQAIDKTGTALHKIGTNMNQIARYVHYLEHNNMVEGKMLAEYNQHFQELIQVEQAYVKAIRAYLRTNR